MDEQHSHSFFASKASIVGLFAVLSAVLTIPLALTMIQQPQNLLGRASEPNTESKVSINPTSTVNREKMVSGYVYHDKNQDGKRDNEEMPFPGMTISIAEMGADDKNRNPVELKSDKFGYFTYNLLQSSRETEYIIKIVLPDGYKTISTNPVLLSPHLMENKEIIEFGLYPLAKTDAFITPVPTYVNHFLTGD